ncbi:hypothetical protein [Roseomonas rosulenta]|uniref:hypothetical protein n=1 Tax=Roseomonas rosulenta TaxID=2748667 RepID=UPI0018E05314|nr:hypothetical protein [Roseomonas rosulenta]
MTMRTRTWLFDNYTQAADTVRDLEAAGFTDSDVSIMGKNSAAPATVNAEPESVAAVGASIGTIVGGGAGLMAGLGALAIPGVGPIVAAGWLVALLTGAGAGAAAGSLIGSLTGSGVNEKEAHVYAEGVSRGGSIVTVRADDARMARVEDILARHAPVNIVDREADYRAAGWRAHSSSNPTRGTSPDGTPGNPPGTMASRAVDEIAGTNVSGARPENEGRRG